MYERNCSDCISRFTGFLGGEVPNELDETEDDEGEPFLVQTVQCLVVKVGQRRARQRLELPGRNDDQRVIFHRPADTRTYLVERSGRLTTFLQLF